MRTALLLWDQLEFIVPYEGYRPQQRNRQAAEAVELVGAFHVPTHTQKLEAHRRIEEFATGPLPPALQYRDERVPGKSTSYMYGQKLLPETWYMLRELNLAGAPSGETRHLEDATGLALMSILTDCCAGESKSRITDRSIAYAQLTDILIDKTVSSHEVEKGYDALVPISLSLIDATTLPLSSLIDIRRREAKSSGNDLAQLRARYRDRINQQILAMSTMSRPSDIEEIKRQFEQDMADDIANLKGELRIAKAEVLTSKDVWFTALIAGAGVGGALGSMWSGVVGATVGIIPSVGGVLNARFKYAKERRAIMSRHPMAYMLEVSGR